MVVTTIATIKKWDEIKCNEMTAKLSTEPETQRGNEYEGRTGLDNKQWARKKYMKNEKKTNK